MPTIIKRGDKFLARVRRQGFSPVSQTFIRKTDAVAWGRRVEADMQAGKWVDEPAQARPSLKEAIAEYRHKVAVRLKGARDYAYSFKEIEASDLGGKPLDQLKPSDLAEWRDALAGRGLKPATVARRLGLLSGVLSWCHKEKGWLADNPMRSVRKPTVRDARTRTLDPEEVRYLELATSAARATWLPDAVILLIRTAMRRSELVGLQCGDVDLARSVAILQDSKNGEQREVPLCPEAKMAIARLTADAVKQGRKAVLPINDPEAVSFAFRRAVVRARARYEEDCAASGAVCDSKFMHGIRLHDLRHHAVSVWARTGGLSLIELMKVSGHKSPRMLARYAHLSSEEVAAKMATLNV
ncbi:MAG: site-specific integrase [Rhizobacter sp.]|nr:site-specific integrase [Rhizobacter sp.]